MPRRNDELAERYEARREAAPLVVVVPIALISLALVSWAEEWEVIGQVRWWIWIVLALPAFLLCVDLWLGARKVGFASTRGAALVLSGVIVGGNLIGVAVLVSALVTAGGSDLSGGQLLMTTAVIWLTNTIVFGLWFWELDDGGPSERARKDRVTPDFRFPQDVNPDLAPDGWHPRVWDYLYLSVTNSSAFSPSDEMPLSVKAKVLMGTEAVLSLVLVVLVTARAVSALPS
ncbi:MAG: hypothetical protein ACRDNY_07240 [Gaiellaceae bacterium]